MKTRIVSGLIMLPLLVVVLLGDWVLFVACFFVGVVGVYEFFKGFSSLEIRPSFPIAIGSAVLLYLMEAFSVPMGMELWIFLTVLSCLLYGFNLEKRRLEDGMATLLGIFYVILFSFFITKADRSAENTEYLVWLIIFGAFSTDVMAYFTGMALGKHKLCPTISPKKTVEGSLGGILGSIVVCGLVGLIFRGFFGASGWDVIHCLIIGALCGVFSQLGDLTASVFKRKMGIKDYGHLIPGHGGILDRFDSVLFTAPLVYFYYQLVIAHLG